MKRKTVYRILGAAVLLAAGILQVQAALERVGPVPTTHGFPAWYQDTTGLTLEFGTPLNDAELNEGWNLLLPGDVPGPLPEVFPSNFADEHFYWAANSSIDFTAPGVGATRALLVLGLEAAFGGGPPKAGDQMVFGRIRIRILAVPFDGDYTVYTPYGVYTFPNETAGNQIFFTEDIGLAPGAFNEALNSSIGPFLVPSNTPGGPELAPVAGPVLGKLYIANPVRVGPVTGSPRPPFRSPLDGIVRNHNIFRIEGPNNFAIESVNFDLVGRIYNGPINSRVSIDRAQYVHTLNQTRVKVFATGLPTTQGRLPGSLPPPAVNPVLRFYNAPAGIDPISGALIAPAGQTPIAMLNTGVNFWGQSQPAALPAAITVEDTNARDAGGNVISQFFQAPLTDEVTVTRAVYNPSNGGSLLVTARSSDSINAASLHLSGTGDLVGGRIVVAPLAAPPSKIFVHSTRGGMGELPVSQGGETVAAANDTFTVAENSPRTSINVLGNDTFNGNPIQYDPADVWISINDVPQLGTAIINADGTIGYTPLANASGSDVVGYKVTVGTDSSTASLAITINPVIGAPSAINDTAALTEDTPAAIPVLANDQQNGQPVALGGGDSVTIVTDPLLGTATVNPDGSIQYTPQLNANGNDSFTYRARINGLDSNVAAVAVAIAPVDDPPTAVDDSFNVVAGTRILNVVANDPDVDTTPDLLSAVIVTPPAAGASVTGGSNVTFICNAAGVYTFTYRARDQFGSLSVNTATVTVTVTVPATEVINIQQATYRTTARRWIVSGVDSVRVGQTLTISYDDGVLAGGASAAGVQIGTAVVDAAGGWLLDIRSVTGPLDPTNRTVYRTLPTRIRVTSPQGGLQAGTFSIRQ